MKKRVLELDALRGIAALSVVLFHFTMGRQQAELGFKYGCLGVEMFFIISGFVIFMSIEKLDNWKTFVWHRFIRLYPAYWVSVTITALLVFISGLFIFKNIHDEVLSYNYLIRYLGNMTMIQHFMGIVDIDGPYWTLSIELVFYLLIVIILITKKVNQIENIGIILIVFAALYQFEWFLKNSFFRFIIIYCSVIRYFPLFFAGILFYKMKHDKITPKRIILLALTFVIQCSLLKLLNLNHINLYEFISCLFVIYGAFFLFLFDKLNFIVNPVTVKLGELSYSLYLIHQFMSVSIIIPGLIRYAHLSFWPSAAICLVFIIFISYLINKFVEKPALKHFKNYIK